MRRFNQILFITLLISILGYTYSSISFIPEEELVFDQVAFQKEALVGENITVGMFIKNFLDYSITNITVSLNLTDASQLKLTSCSLGDLSGDNITINETMTSPIINEFTAVNITGVFMSDSYLEYNISEIKSEEKMIFKYNVTANEVTDSQIPWAFMSFYDNWTDLQENIRISSRALLSFGISGDGIDPNLPQWNIGNPIPEGWAWVIFAVVPAVVAAVAAFILYFRRR
ncbi:hypothetical protein EU534_00225 [Candidatus Heimdallarchaeota archaeon]|nr:MAG: hypothetical protein EU534_00225 [Candidatus Heimdallarchaeota archaeon]